LGRFSERQVCIPETDVKERQNMHELSIVQSLFGLLEKHVKENQAQKVVRVVVKIGRLSGIEPDLLKVAFDTFKSNTVAQDAELCLEVPDIVFHCNHCKKNFISQVLVFQCPLCDNNGDINIVEGDEMVLQSLELVVGEKASPSA
jgi:hydrogenase nickel incorporation protein HypA/HybF